MQGKTVGDEGRTKQPDRRVGWIWGEEFLAGEDKRGSAVGIGGNIELIERASVFASVAIGFQIDCASIHSIGVIDRVAVRDN